MDFLDGLKIKPKVGNVNMVYINYANKTKFVDKRYEGYDDTDFKQKLLDSNLSKVKNKPKPQEPRPQPQPQAQEEEPVEPKPKPQEVEKEADAAEPEKPKPSKKKKGEEKKGEPEVDIDLNTSVFNNKPILKYLPKKEDKMIIKMPSYYMNNREIFINSINSIFEPYKKELMKTSDISCDNIGKSTGELSLLTHQKITRDYLNIITPYRGLILYHGLGSGKTCTSIAIAEGMKDHKKIIIMTPASLRDNYMVELKKCGDLLFRRKQYWKWVSVVRKPNVATLMSKVLSIPLDFVKKRKGAWFVDVNEPSNYASLSASDKASLDEQLDKMIESKYMFINYNGMRNKHLSELTDGYTKNLFDGAVVIIDEAHNLISRIVNKIKNVKDTKKKEKAEDEEEMPKFLSLRLYEYLMSATDAKIVLLTGTPIINYPNEFGILFNILRGHIKTWSIPLNVKTTLKIDKAAMIEMFSKEKTLDYIDYSPSTKILTVTRNPFGFHNVMNKQQEYTGVSHETRDKMGNVVLDENYVSDDLFEKRIVGVLNNNKIEIAKEGIKRYKFKALPDTLDGFKNLYINDKTLELKNVDSLKRRILGLSSYFKSAQEDLLPSFSKNEKDFHVITIPMSDFQFKLYEKVRRDEREQARSQRNKDDMFEASSSYRIFSRLYCNFTMVNRPMPISKKQTTDNADETNMSKIMKNAKKLDTVDVSDNNEGELEIEDLFQMEDSTYNDRINLAITNISNNADNYLTESKLEIYSPKYLQMLKKIINPDLKGLHLVYSQFRTLEGVGMFSLVLDHNGMSRFKIKLTGTTWDLDMPAESFNRPMYALYTGTESREEKEIIRNIYNSSWDEIPTNISEKLKKIHKNNMFGEIIKVLMITSSGSEGINLRNTRYVHIMEPYWHPVRMEQVIGRARRICSHSDLPKEFQTVEVFVYLMTLSEKQIKSDDAIELTRKDVSKLIPNKPVTSDELLYEISSIKERLVKQLTQLIKETSFDCGIYSHGKEKITCMNFSNPSKTAYSYNPDYAKEQRDTILKTNVSRVEWTGKIVRVNNIEYVSKQINPTTFEIYDMNSYNRAKINQNEIPIQVGTIKMVNGIPVFNPI
jgi:hypothetical protein